MEGVNQQIKRKVRESVWRSPPFGNSPHDTFSEIVGDSFDTVKKLSRSATRCRMNEMYQPEIGELRKSKSYSALSPGNGMRFSDRRVMPGDLRPYSPYKTKQSEWMLTKERPKVTGRVQGKPVPFSALPPLPPTRRRQFPVPSDATRFENFAVYWGGRAKGLDLSSPFIYDRIRDNYGITEDRRYQRLYWAPSMITQQPTARHGRQVLLTAY